VTDRRNIDIVLWDEGYSEHTEPVVDLIARLKDLLADVPKEFRSLVIFQYSPGSYGQYGDSASLRIYYTRAETDEELAVRAARNAEYERESSEREIQSLRYLKSKYPNI